LDNQHNNHSHSYNRNLVNKENQLNLIKIQIKIRTKFLQNLQDKIVNKWLKMVKKKPEEDEEEDEEEEDEEEEEPVKKPPVKSKKKTGK